MLGRYVFSVSYRRSTRCAGNVASGDGMGSNECCTSFESVADTSFVLCRACEPGAGRAEGKMDLYIETIAKDCSRKISM